MTETSVAPESVRRFGGADKAIREASFGGRLLLLGPALKHTASSIVSAAVAILIFQRVGLLRWGMNVLVGLQQPATIPLLNLTITLSRDASLLLIWGILFATTFWGLGGLQLLPALYPDLFSRIDKHWKIQPDVTLMRPNRRAHFFEKVIPTVVVNWVIAWVSVVMASKILVNPDCFTPDGVGPEILTIPRMLKQSACFALSVEVLFYLSHRAVHASSYLYRKIHKKHHEWTAPVAWNAIYAHPLEHVVCNMSPMAVGLYLGQPHICVWLALSVLGVVHTMVVHSGFLWCDDDGFHDMHHEKFEVDYGVSGLCDILFGTYRTPRGVSDAAVIHEKPETDQKAEDSVNANNAENEKKEEKKEL